MQLQFMIDQNEFVEFLVLFRDNRRIWVTWAFSIICVCTTTFKVSTLPLYGVVVIVMEMDTATRVQILDVIDCISYSTNNLGEGMNPIILPPAMGK